MKYTRYTNIQSLVSVSKEEVDSYWEKDWIPSQGILPKFNDMSPEFLRIGFFTDKTGKWNRETRELDMIRCQVFDNLWNWDDLQTLHAIIGNPVAIAGNPVSTSEDRPFRPDFESFKNLQIADLIRLSKAFTILFSDSAKRPCKNLNKENPGWIIANIMDSLIFQRTSDLDNNEITDTLPQQFILEPPALYIQLFNDSGCYRMPTVWTHSNWQHGNNQEKLQTWRDYIGCPITKIPDENRYQVDITTPQQFLRLLKSYSFIHRYNPKTGITSLIYTQGVTTTNVSESSFHLGHKAEKQ